MRRLACMACGAGGRPRADVGCAGLDRRGTRRPGEQADAAAPAGTALRALGDATTFDITGNVLDYSHVGVPRAEVWWGSWDTSGNYDFGNTNMATDPNGTDSSGAFSFPAVTSVPNSDDLTVWYPYASPGFDPPASFLGEARDLD